MILDCEVVDLLGNDPELLAVADAVAAAGQPRACRAGRARRASLFIVPVLAAMMAPIGGASVVSRASTVFGLGGNPPAPAPYQTGDQVWTHDAPVGGVAPAVSLMSGPASVPAAPAPYSGGDQVWTTTPDVAPTTETIPCESPADAASALQGLEQAGSTTNAVECR